MNTKIKELTESIYKEGIEKAKKESDVLVARAKEEAEGILDGARQKAEAIIADAKTESKKIYSSMQEELDAISEQMIEITKQRINNLMTAKLSKELAAQVTSDPRLLHEMMLEITKSWTNGNSQTNEARVSEVMAEKLEPLYKKYAAQALNSGLVLKPVPGMAKGFQLVNNHEGYKLSFTDEDFQTFFESLIKPRIRKLLFNS